MSSADVQVRSAPKWMPVGAWQREEYVTPTWSEMGETLMHDGGPGLSEWAFSMDLEHETVTVASSASTPHFVDWPDWPRAASPTTHFKHLEWGRKISPNDITVVASATPRTIAQAVNHDADDIAARIRNGRHGASHDTPPDESGTRQGTRVAGAAKSFQECMEG